MTSNQEDQSIDTSKVQVLPYEGRKIKFVVLEAKVAKSCDSIWLHYLRAEEKFKNTTDIQIKCKPFLTSMCPPHSLTF